MSAFYDYLNEVLGAPGDMDDIRVVSRRLWFYDFDGYPVRLWQGQGMLHAGGEEWRGTLGADGKSDVHRVPRVSDGRDGTAKTYEFGFKLMSYPGTSAREVYDRLKAVRETAYLRPIREYRVIFRVGEKEGLRPTTPIQFRREYTMFQTKFSERLTLDGTRLARDFNVTVIAKGDNAGRSFAPNRKHTDTSQRAYAASLGVENDRGAEFIAGLANREYHRP